MDNSKLSLNSTFSIEDDRSYLSNFGTPLNFKKLSERPATVASDKFNNGKTHLNFKAASNIRLNSQLYQECNMANNSGFVSPLPSHRNLLRNKFNNQSPMCLSPIQYNVKRQQKPQPFNNCLSPMPILINRNARVLRFELDKSVENVTKPCAKVQIPNAVTHSTPQRHFNSGTDIEWSINRKKAIERQEEEQKFKKLACPDLSPISSPSSFIERMKQYAEKNSGHRRLSKEVAANKENVATCDDGNDIKKRLLEMWAEDAIDVIKRKALPQSTTQSPENTAEYYERRKLEFSRMAASSLSAPRTTKTTAQRPQSAVRPTKIITTPCSVIRQPRAPNNPASSTKKWR